MVDGIWTSATAVHVLSTDDGLAEFDEAFVDPAKRALLRDIKFEVVLPEISIKRLKKVQSNAEAAANDAAFTRAISDFLGRLARWEARDDGASLSLTITAESPTHKKRKELVENGTLTNSHNSFGPSIWEIRNMDRMLRFEAGNPPQLPEVPCITKLCCVEYLCPRSLHPGVQVAISNACVAASVVEWDLCLPGRRTMPARVRERAALAQALRDAKLANVTELMLTLNDNDPMNEAFELDSLLEQHDDLDSLSLGVRHIAQLPMLRKLELRGTWILSPVAFGPHPELPDVHCSLLEEIVVDVSMCTPDGRYLMMGDPEDAGEDDGYYESGEEPPPAPFDSDDSDTSDWAPEFAWGKEEGDIPVVMFRTTPNDETFVPIWKSFARAARCSMPKLRNMTINFGTGASHAPSEAQYYTAGAPATYFDSYPSCTEFSREHAREPRWYFTSHEDFDKSWRPPQGLRDELEGPDEDGRKRHVYWWVKMERIEI
ncbi:hypothetical protein PFICI_01653 [Pestalotiopsis fici W106-1]|uniref:Uncharacterized protein n=1 Tax=Pestalotiopsis fici (strain W106-1 / CGMCC3.15140) TaxID=1229662 RepID=W3XPE3_PESFW|nr:uncharacterized protein PFICI_01653 [Pestalotiopsis fici W106-1]ETS87825.1 hypothetical protein PFICI_01653 [Pestalotiopsis fici W106-1]